MADNPETSEGTGTEVQQDDSLESASQAILDIDKEEEESNETERSQDSEKEEVAEDEDVESEDEEVAEEEEESEPQLYTIKVDGKDTDVTLEELQSGYLKQSDYTKKTSELAEQRKAMMQEAQAIQQERQQYAQALGQMKSDAEKTLDEYKALDWNTLREQDPMLFMQRRDEQRELEKSIDQSEKEQQHLQVQAQQYQQQRFTEEVETGKKQLLSIMPDWNDKTSKSVREFGLEQGFSNEELSGITDARSMAVLRKAMMYDNIQKAQPAKKKVKADTPKYVKAGVTKSKADVSAKQRSDKLKQLRKSGTVEDGASLIFDML